MYTATIITLFLGTEDFFLQTYHNVKDNVIEIFNNSLYFDVEKIRIFCRIIIRYARYCNSTRLRSTRFVHVRWPITFFYGIKTEFSLSKTT